MSFVQPLVMRHNGVRLGPLALSHEDGLRAARVTEAVVASSAQSTWKELSA